jgi:hypothetical protein
MGARTTYAPGTFSWVDLATTDVAAAKDFYAALFGWELEDTDAGGGATYTMCRVGGDAVCGLYERSGDGDGGAPAWTSYVTVADADAAATRAADLGGETVMAAFDVLDAGRMALLRDPQGALLAVWQAGTRIGADRVNDPGCLCMNELSTTDVDAARAFYEALFGWTTEDTGPDGPGMVVVLNGEAMNGSVFRAQAGEPAHWRPCFTVESADTAVRRAVELGGTDPGRRLELPDGIVAILHDPQGAVFSVFAGETDP